MNTAHPVSPRHQLGGTLLGFVIGLLVGLGAALAVAVYVTRVPVPFVDRGLHRGAEADAQEAERNKGWNPNKGVGGGSAPAPAPAAPAEGTVSTPPADGKALPAPAESAAKPSTSKDPLGDLVQQRLGQEPAKAATAPAAAEAPAPGADPFTYFVQAGAFRSAEDAEAQRAKLGMMGIHAQVSEREQNGRTVYRVRVGPFNQKALAELTQEQLSSSGIESALVRVQR